MKSKKSCSSCFYSESFPRIKIDEEGICNSCKNNKLLHDKNLQTNSNLTDLRKLFEDLKQKRKGKYDCIIGASGGLDSSYVIYVARKQLGLNPLVISYDSGFTYDHAFDNLKSLCNKLNVDLRIIKSIGHYDKKYVKSIVKALNNMDAYWGICKFCNYILPDVVYNQALKEDISLLLNSSNIYEARLNIPKFFRLKFMIKAMIGDGIYRIPKMIFYILLAQYYLLKLKLEFYVPPFSNVFKVHPKNPLTNINITKYVEWDIEYMVDILKEEAGWKLPDHPNIMMRFDCMIEDSFINHTYKEATGMTVHGIIANNLISCGIKTKRQLEKAVEFYDNIIDKRKEQIRKYLDI